VPVVVTVPPVSGPLKVIEVTVPLPGGAAQVPSPRQNVALDALVPLLRLITGRLPVISLVSETAPNDGAPAAFPCNTVDVVPSEPSADIACKPPPSTSRFSVSAAAAVVQVRQPIVPVLVIVPPVRGPLTTMLVTVPLPAGVAQIPSPRQNVVELAALPLLR
jgi:hypothetical protein